MLIDVPKVVELVDGGARWILLSALPLSDPGQVTSRPSPRFPHLQNEMTRHSDVKSPFRTPRPRDCVTGTRKVIQPQTNLVGGTASWAPRFLTLLPSCPHAHLFLSKPCKISFCKSHPLFVLFSNSELQKPFLSPVKALPRTLQGSSFSMALQAGGYQPSGVYRASVTGRAHFPQSASGSAKLGLTPSLGA